MHRTAVLIALSLAWSGVGFAADSGSSGRPPLGIGEPRAPEPFTLELRFLQAARDGDRKTIERALARGVSPNAKDELGRSALLLATGEFGSLELVQLLQAKGAPIDEPDLSGRAAISWAAAWGRTDVVRFLADRGAAVDRKDGEGRTPLWHAVTEERLETVELLLDRGASPNTPDRFGDTPLMMACAKGYDGLAGLLLKRGADPAARNQEGKTAADRATPDATRCREAGALSSPR
jgi:ankyrin repeat protein